jgi:CBS domain-containing protein
MNFKPEMKSKEQLASGQPKYESVVNYMVPAAEMVTVSADQKIQDVIDIFLSKKISGAPVLAENNRRLVGIISEKDCLRIIIDQAYHNLPISDRKVSDYMTINVMTLPSTSSIVDAADEFLKLPVRRLPVVDDGILIGQVSRRDILRAAKKITPTTW